MQPIQDEWIRLSTTVVKVSNVHYDLINSTIQLYNSHERNAYNFKQFKIDCIRQFVVAINPQKFIFEL